MESTAYFFMGVTIALLVYIMAIDILRKINKK